MRSPHGPSVPHVEVPDGAEAMRKMDEFTRRVLAVPKKKIDAMIAVERKKKKKR
jgi:hypothetical protein